MSSKLSYSGAGVDIDNADSAKGAMRELMRSDDPSVLSVFGSFASLIDARFPQLESPVLVFKMEEPGSKQKLAVDYGRLSTIGFDLVNHLVNDIVVMGARPLVVQDCIVCGKLEKQAVAQIVGSIVQACREQGCSLVGGETSEQPGVVAAGTYVLSASIIGVVERSMIVDGSAVRSGDIVLAIASNGLHTNGYSLVRALIRDQPEVLNQTVAGRTFLDCILEPHRCYWRAVRDLTPREGVHAMSHITGGGISDNLKRVLPPQVSASLDLGLIRVLPLFSAIRARGDVSDADMMRTFNLGVGMVIVVAPDCAERLCATITGRGYECYQIGAIKPGAGEALFSGRLSW